MTLARAFGSLAAGFVVCSLTAVAVAEGVAAPPAPPPAPSPRSAKACNTPEFRQFDFWLGDWSVADPNGNIVGKNVVTLELGGCVLHENWTGTQGSSGRSFNIYDGTTKRWHQTWVDDSGTLLSLNGGLVDGRMVLSGPGRGARGEMVTNRIAWEKLADGRVRQTWTVSSDGGKAWTTSFDGYYTKR